MYDEQAHRWEIVDGIAKEMDSKDIVHPQRDNNKKIFDTLILTSVQKHVFLKDKRFFEKIDELKKNDYNINEIKSKNKKLIYKIIPINNKLVKYNKIIKNYNIFINYSI